MNKKLKTIFLLFIVLGVVAMIILPIWVLISLVIFQVSNLNIIDLHEWLVATYIVASFSLLVDVYLFYKFVFTEGKEPKKE